MQSTWYDTIEQKPKTENAKIREKRLPITLPRGWVLMTLKENGVALKLRSIDPDHPKHAETIELAWR